MKSRSLDKTEIQSEDYVWHTQSYVCACKINEDEESYVQLNDAFLLLPAGLT